MDDLRKDLRYALRMLVRSPGFSAVAVATLAMGIGANTAMFSVVNTVLLRPLPFEEPDRLVMVYGQLLKYDLPRLLASQPEYLDYRKRTSSFERLAAYVPSSFNITGGVRPEWAQGAQVSADFFPLLGASPAVGRAFSPEDDAPDGAPVAIVSYGFWQRRFAGNPDIIGREISLDGVAQPIVGVMPAGFAFPAAGVEVWTPLRIDPARPAGRGSHYLRVLGRLRSGTTLAQAQAEMDHLARLIEEERPDNYAYKEGGWGIPLVPLEEVIAGTVRPALLVLLAAVGFVLLIACANVANLMLARAGSREREIAIRTAIGAGRGRVVRQLLTESLVLSGIGGGVGLLLAVWGIDALTTFGPADIPRLDQVGIDGRVLIFTMALSLLTGVLFGLVPALQLSKPDLTGALKEGGRQSAGRRRRRTGGLLVVSEVALALVLLIAAGLMIRSFARIQAVDPGYDPHNVLTLRLILTPTKYTEAGPVAGFYTGLLGRLTSLPGVTSAGAISELPLGGVYSSGTVAVEDRLGDPDNDNVEVDRRSATPGYFRAMKIPLLAGRFIEERDTADAPGVVIIDDSMARRFWGDVDPIGRRIKLGSADSPNPWLTIAGVVRHVKQYGLDVEGREQVYFPASQQPRLGMFLVLRTGGDPAALADPVRREVLALDPDQPVFSVRTMETWLAESMARSRFSMVLLGLFGALALVLAAIGIYGVMAFIVGQRNHEIGIRMALGARKDDVLRLVLRQGLALTAAGIGLGLVAAVAATRLLSSLLFRVSALDPLTFLTVTLLLGGVALLSVAVPARRASRVDPTVALRCE